MAKMIGDLPGKVLGLLADLCHKLQHGVITVRELELFLQRQNPFAITDICQEWQEFYRKYFRLAVDFSSLVIPDNPGDFDRIIFIPQGLKINQVINAMRKRFKVWTYIENLDKDITVNVRTSDRSYAIRLRERVKADEELKNLSANQLQEQGVNAITLLERLIYELKYYDETGQHLDVNNLTLCAGSRFAHGQVPDVYWVALGGKLLVCWCDPGYANGGLRARQAVSS